MKTPRALVLRAPGINCDRETAQACRLVGFATDLLHINTLLKAPEHLLDYDFLVIPGGFSYGDDLGAGTLLAKNLTIHLGQQLQQFIDEGRPILGICNGFQVLVRAGLLPDFLTIRGDTSDEIPGASLTDNASAQFECRWVTLSIQPGPCIFTKGIGHCIELPIAHGEGRFVLADAAMLPQLLANGQIPLVYTGPNGGRGRLGYKVRRATIKAHLSTPHPARPYGLDGHAPRNLPVKDATQPPPLRGEIPYPYNPNGSIGNIAGICNAQGNVFGLMPHPERYVHALQHPQRRYGQNGQGDGLLIFANAFDYAKALQLHVRTGIY
jgi:phosphoribosylformylglycinamidine (FGAM) synthase-like amidotransferase family enzyme